MARLLKKLHALSGSSTHHCSMHRWTVDIICWNYSSAGWKSTMFNYHLEGTANHILDRSSSFHFSLHFRVPWLMSHSPHDSPMAPKKMPRNCWSKCESNWLASSWISSLAFCCPALGLRRSPSFVTSFLHEPPVEPSKKKRETSPFGSVWSKYI